MQECENCKNEKTCHLDWHYKGLFDEFVSKCEFYENKEEKLQMHRINRAKLRGQPLDEDCKRAHTTTGEYGKEDKRVFCFGYIDCMYDELLDKCKKCKAHINNLTPLKDFIEVETRPYNPNEKVEKR